MGLAASQARMLSLVSRKSDLEYRGQMINQRRLLLATQTEQVALDYNNAISNRVLTVKNKLGNDVSITSANLASAGFAVIDTTISDPTKNRVTSNDASEIERNLRSGIYQIQQLVSGSPSGTNIAWTANTSFDDNLYTADDAIAESTYAYKSAELQAQDKVLELELKNVDTQHNAVQTEIDAVKKVIEKNIESSFKTFG